MRMRVFLILLLGLLCEGLSPSSHLKQQDKTRLIKLFEQNCTPDADITTIYHCVQGLKLLGASPPNKDQLCKLTAALSDESSLEALFAATSAAAALGCPLKLGAKASDAVKAGSADGSSVASLYFASYALVNTGGKVDKGVLAALSAALAKNDTLLNLGLGFHVAALLSGDVNKIFERVEDAIVQADEVDGKMLQFEGGLSVTSIVLTGAASLSAKVKKPLPINSDQAVKFANYLLSRKSVQQTKGALHLLEGIESMTGAAQFTPLAISLASSMAISFSNPNVVISVLDLKGNSPGDLTVTLDSVAGSVDGSSLATAVKMTKTSDGFSADLMAKKPEPGFYDLTVSAVPAKSDPKIVGNKGVKLTVKVLAEQKVTNTELKIVDNDSGTKSLKLTHPEKKTGLTVRQKDKIQLTFKVESVSSGTPLTVHQAFVKVTHIESKAEIIYVAEADANDVYKFELDIDAEADLLKGSGVYSFVLMLGDAVVSNPVSWTLAEINLELSSSAPVDPPSPFQPKPEIKHLFREPEQRPPQMVSTVFTLLCLSPFLILVVLWFKLGANIYNFSFSLSALGFHLGLGAIFMLYVLFWLELNMFQTMQYLALFGTVTFIAGNCLLSSIAKKNK